MEAAVNDRKNSHQEPVRYPDTMSEKSAYDAVSSLVENGEIDIDAIEWSRLNQLYTRDELTAAIKHNILIGNIKLPLKKITEDEAITSFEFLRDYKPIETFGAMFSKYDYIDFPIESGLYYEGSNSGNDASDYFQQRNRYTCGSVIAPSPVRTWESSKFLDGLMKSLYTLKVDKVDSSTLRTCLALRKYVASQFKPTVAKAIYERFKSVDVLDFSAGWGDRLCGFYASKSTRSYIGIDPNGAVHEGYKRQINFYEQWEHKETELIKLPAEDAFIPEGSVDTVFTSPPYYNLERYCEEDTQSFKRYKKLDEWLDGFLYRALDMSYKALKKGGYLCINISDVYSGHRVNHICDPMNRYLKKRKMEYCGVIGIKMAKRPNSKAAGIENAAFVEPIWIWRKN